MLKYLVSISLVVCAVALIVLPLEARAAMEGVEFIKPEGTIGAYAVTLPDGRIMTWWTEGKGETDPASINNPDIPQKAFARYSSDSGKTWSEPELLFEFPREKGAYFGMVMFVDRDRAIHLFGLHFFGYDLENPDNWDAWESYAFHVMSSDGGKIWSRPQHCDFGHRYTGMTNSIIQLKSGRLVLPVSYYSQRKTGRFVTNCSLSDDGGKTWRASKGECVVDTGGGGIESGGCEPVAIEMKDGRVWMMIRTQGGYQYESFSSDGGDTWTEPAPSRFVCSNSPAEFLRLRDGRMVFVWQNSYDGAPISYARQVLAAAISSDDGKTWSGYREVARVGLSGETQGCTYPYLAETPSEAQHQIGDRQLLSCTYPYLAETPNGMILMPYVSYTYGGAFARIDPDWLEETSLKEDFARGTDSWSTWGAEPVTLVQNPDGGGQVLAFRKPKADVPAGASLSFPFGVRGHLTMRVRVEPGFQGARLCLTDFWSAPGGKQDGRFGVDIPPDGMLTPGEWHTVGLAWDCEKRVCKLSVDYKPVADLPQLSDAPGVCYLRLWSAATQTDEAGMLVESVSTNGKP